MTAKHNERGTSLLQGTTPEILIGDLAGLPKDEGFIYKGVITNYKHLGQRNVQNHEKEGYSIVYDTFGIKDDRKFSPNQNTAENSVPGPIIGRTADNYNYIVMKISKERFEENMKKRDADYDHQRQASVGKVTRTGRDSVKIDGGEINFDKK